MMHVRNVALGHIIRINQPDPKVFTSQTLVDFCSPKIKFQLGWVPLKWNSALTRKHNKLSVVFFVEQTQPHFFFFAEMDRLFREFCNGSTCGSLRGNTVKLIKQVTQI